MTDLGFWLLRPASARRSLAPLSQSDPGGRGNATPGSNHRKAGFPWLQAV